ncbi:MAG TPA: DUF4912 domain-containing protein [Oscillatoriales cyanobacterium M59_W2019_021]|nr:DUF4912 domain-containing protein [Oscillatoriales cyanobacterium M4454_W2019_049]HIK52489.1 DUF4912 domain-containing protein [Oscillatoriales cyanobacterium M59_W2019_021]
MLRNVLKKPTFAAFKIAVGIVLTATSTIASFPTGDRVRAQSSQSQTRSVERSENVPSGSKLRVDGSSSMIVTNNTLKQRYERQYPGASVDLKADGSDLALQEVREGDIEVAAIGRHLTAEEKASDLNEQRLNREKIAIVVGANNPYRGNMSYQDFAKIFRGEITDWSEVGGPPGRIRLVDRPENSDTRNAFNSYDIFREREFSTGDTAEPMTADSTDEMVANLGTDGIGYAIASQVMDRDDVWIVPMHKTLPDDPRYPFSQPRTYVYKGAATPATAAFLGLAGVVGQESIAGAATVPPYGGEGTIATSVAPATGTVSPSPTAPPTGGSTSGGSRPPAPGSPASGGVPATTPPIAAAPSPTATPPLAAAPPSPKPPEIVASQPKVAQAPETTPSPMETASLPPPEDIPPGLIGNDSILPHFWWLLPIGLIALLVWWGVRKLRSQPALGLEAGDEPTPPPIAGTDTAALPPSTAPEVSTLPSEGAIAPTELETLRPAAPDAIPPSMGSGGAIAGGMAASSLGSDEPETTATPTTGEGGIAPETQEPLTTDISTPTTGTGMTPANLGLAGGAALAGGWAASQLGRTGEDAPTTPTSDVPDATTEIPAASGERITAETSEVDRASDSLWEDRVSPPGTRDAASPLGGTAAEVTTTPETPDAVGEMPGVSAGEGADSTETRDANVADVGLAGGAAASPLGRAPDEEIATPPTAAAEMRSSEIAPSSPEEISEVPTTDPNLTNLGLAGGAALAGGWAASQLGRTGEGETPTIDRETSSPEVPLTPAETDLAETRETPDSPATDANVANLGVSGGLAASQLGDSGDDAMATPETEELAAATEIAATPETDTAETPPTDAQNLGLVAGAAIAGGLAASQLGETGDEDSPELADSETADSEAMAAAASTSATDDFSTPEDRLTAETEEATATDAADLDLAAGAALAGGAAPGAGLPGGAAALAGGAAPGAGLGASDAIVEPSGADEFVPSASGADEFISPVSDEFVPSVEETADDTPEAAPVFAPMTPAFDPANAAAAAGLAAGIPIDFEPSDDLAQSDVEAAKFNLGQTEIDAEELASVDEGLPDLPDGYGESRIVLVPCNPQWVYAYWDIPNADKEELRRQGGSQLALRFYDVTDIDIATQVPHSLQQYACEEMARDWYLPVPAGDRDYIVEIGYVANDGRWLSLVRSQPIRVPPFYPSDWQNDRFATVPWKQELSGDKTIVDLGIPQRNLNGNGSVYDSLFALAQESQRMAGSEFLSGIGLFPSGVGMVSGMGMSGAGFSASMPPIRSRKFWLVADAELIVYGATAPDASVTIGGVPVPLSPDGTFRFQMAFPDGEIDYPIMAVAADGQQTRSIHMNFKRETRHRNTNTLEEAEDEVH